MTDAQQQWLAANPGFEPVGRPRQVRFSETGTLYADGTYEPIGPMKPIVLSPGCFGVGKRITSEEPTQ